MGINVSTLRKAKTPIYIDGIRIMAWNHQYAYKVSYSGEYSDRSWGKSYRFVRANAHRRAAEAFEVYTGGYVVQTDMDGKTHEGYNVFKNLTDPINHCTDDMPGEWVGTLVKVVNRWSMIPREIDTL